MENIVLIVVTILLSLALISYLVYRLCFYGGRSFCCWSLVSDELDGADHELDAEELEFQRRLEGGQIQLAPIQTTDLNSSTSASSSSNSILKSKSSSTSLAQHLRSVWNQKFVRSNPGIGGVNSTSGRYAPVGGNDQDDADNGVDDDNGEIGGVRVEVAANDEDSQHPAEDFFTDDDEGHVDKHVAAATNKSPPSVDIADSNLNSAPVNVDSSAEERLISSVLASLPTLPQSTAACEEWSARELEQLDMIGAAEISPDNS